MALTKSYTAMQASASNTAGSTTTPTAVLINYGLSIIAKITNGGTGPTVACDAVLEVSDDNSTFFERDRRTAGVTASNVYIFIFDLGVCGAGGDWKYAREKFGGNTAQTVKVQADCESTTAL